MMTSIRMDDDRVCCGTPDWSPLRIFRMTRSGDLDRSWTDFYGESAKDRADLKRDIYFLDRDSLLSEADVLHPSFG